MPQLDMRGLGAVMRAIGRRLHETEPLSAEQAHAAAGGADVPYCAMVLMRLEQRGVAKRVLITVGDLPELAYVRGPRWEEAAHVYHWPHEHG